MVAGAQKVTSAVASIKGRIGRLLAGGLIVTSPVQGTLSGDEDIVANPPSVIEQVKKGPAEGQEEEEEEISGDGSGR